MAMEGRVPRPGEPPTGLRRAIGATLRWGAALSALLLALGIGLWLASRLSFHTPLTYRLSGSSLANAIAHPSAAGLLLLGILVLVLTPMSRVALAAGAYASVGDRRMLGVSAFVLIVLAATVILGVVR